MENTCRGYMIASTLAYIDRSYDEATKQKILNALSPAAREVATAVNGVQWYPVANISELFREIANHHVATDGKPEKALEAVGRTIATMAMNSFLRLLMKLMTPGLFARKVPDFWSRDNRTGSLRAELIGDEARQLKLVHEDVGQYDYIGGVAPGFVKAALDAIGCKNIRYTSDWTLEKPAQDVIHYEFRWD